MKKYMMKISRLPLATFLILAGLSSLLSACTGGGGGVTGAAGISYTGVTTQAPLTAENANILFSALWYGGSPSGSTGSLNLAPASSKAGSAGSLKNDGVMSLARRLNVRLPGDVAAFSAKSKNIHRATPIHETYNGTVSGTKTITGSIDANTGKGILNITYINYNDGDGSTFDGAVTMNLDEYDFAYEITTDWTMNFAAWTIKSAGSDVSLSGSMRLQSDLQNNTEMSTVNVDGLDNISNETFRYENYVETTVYDDLLNPTTGSETYTGRVYVGRYGYVDISTLSPCIYSDPQGDPDSGGPIVLAGAGNTRAKITPLSASYIKIEVDADGDAVYESGNAYPWNSLGGAPVTSGFIANAGLDQSVTVGSLVTIDGSESLDLGGGALTYAWTMTSKPDLSKVALSSLSSNTTTFTPDVEGTYTITLVVSNGTTSSSPYTVDVTATSSLNAIVWSGTQYVVVGNNGYIGTSPDGVNWTVRASGTVNSLRDIIWAGTKYVAVGIYGTILGSTDGVTWKSAALPTRDSLYCVAWSGNLFVAGGAYGTVLTSLDGVIWVSRGQLIGNTIVKIIWTGTQFVALGSSAEILTSSDGVTWTSHPQYLANYYGLAWSGNQFVRVGSYGKIQSSPDGIIWTDHSLSGSDYGFNSVIWSGTQFVAVGYSAFGIPGTYKIFTSPDGVVWTGHDIATQWALNDVIWTGSEYVAVGAGATEITSSDGITWNVGAITQTK